MCVWGGEGGGVGAGGVRTARPRVLNEMQQTSPNAGTWQACACGQPQGCVRAAAARQEASNSAESEAGPSPEGGFSHQSDWSSQPVQGLVRPVASATSCVSSCNAAGGSAVASDAIHREVQLVRASGRKVVVSMGNTAASGGYYISAPADRIIAQPASLTGSIGVVAGGLSGVRMWVGGWVWGGRLSEMAAAVGRFPRAARALRAVAAQPHFVCRMA